MASARVSASCFLAVAFLPKLSAVLLAVPNPVAAAYLLVLMALLFMLGVEIIVQDGVDYRKATVAGVSFWVGVGFQHQLIFAEYIGAKGGLRCSATASHPVASRRSC